MTASRHTIRLGNLELLIKEARSAANLARAANTNSSYLSQVRHQIPTRKGTPRAIGDDLAQRLEKAMKKPHGWMDKPNTHEEDSGPLPTNGKLTGNSVDLYPLIPWKLVDRWKDVALQQDTRASFDCMPCPIGCSPTTFVLQVQGASMEPRFQEGDLIFVDPAVPVQSGQYVILQLNKTSGITFRQLILEGEKQYLKALNPDWPNRIVEAEPETVICGTVVFKGAVINPVF